MEKALRKWSIIGVFVIIALAGFWHFLYDLLPCGLTAAISPVNESPWEHAKLFFVPAIIWYVIMYFAVGNAFPNYIFAHSIALLIMPVFMLLFYTLYSSFLEETFVFDMINSVLTVALGSLIAYKLTVSRFDLSTNVCYIIAMVVVIGMLAVYITFTYNPPMCDLFFDKTQMKYGI